MIRVRNISHAYQSKPVLQGVNMTISPGVMGGLIGPSGGGKSTLLKIIGGIERPDEGMVEHDFSHTSLMFQEGALFDSLTVFDNVGFAISSGGVPPSCRPKKEKQRIADQVYGILDRVGLSWAWYKVPCELSGGMRRRVSLARALVSRPDFVMLDDPTSGLDPVASRIIMDLIVELHHEYRPTMLIVSHDLRRLLPVIECLYALFDRRIQFEGPLSQLADCQYGDIRHFVACRYDLQSCTSEAAST